MTQSGQIYTEKCYRCGSTDITHDVEVGYMPGSLWRPSCTRCAQLRAGFEGGGVLVSVRDRKTKATRSTMR